MGLADSLNTERRPQTGASISSRLTANGWPLGSMQVHCKGSRVMLGSLNNSAPSGLLSRRRNFRKRPVNVCRGITLRAKTQGTPRPLSTTSRTRARRCSGSDRARRSERLGRCKDWLSTSTLNWPSLASSRRWVKDPGSINQSRQKGGAGVALATADWRQIARSEKCTEAAE